MSGYNRKRRPRGYNRQQNGFAASANSQKVMQEFLTQLQNKNLGDTRTPGKGWFGDAYNPNPSGYFNSDFIRQAGNLDETYNSALARGGLASLSGQTSIESLLSLANGQEFDNEIWQILYQTLMQSILNNDQRAYDTTRTQDQREYDYKLLQDQRAYDNPLNQLQRLMASGISRDAAIQIINGTSPSPTAGQPATGNAGSPGTMNTPGTFEQQRLQNVFNGVGQVAQAVGALFNTGMDAAAFQTNMEATKAATAGQLFGNEFQNYSLQGFKNASQVVAALSAARDAGVLDDKHEFSSSHDMISYIQDNASSFEPFNALITNGTLKGITNDVFSLNALNGAYKSWRESRDYGIDRDHIVRSQSLSRMFQSVDIERVQSEIAQNHQQINESINRVINDNIRVDNESSLISAQIELTNQQALGLAAENVYKQQDAKWYDANIESINSVRTNELMLEAAKWQQFMSKPWLLEDAVSAWLEDIDNQNTAVALESMYLANEWNVADDMSSLGSSSNFTQNLKYVATYIHNLMNFALGTKNNKPTDAEKSALGKFSKSATMLHLYRKFGL